MQTRGARINARFTAPVEDLVEDARSVDMRQDSIEALEKQAEERLGNKLAGNRLSLLHNYQPFLCRIFCKKDAIG